LITALLVVALATTAAAALASRQQLDVRRISNLLNSDQAYLHALGVESWAAGLLARDAEAGKSDNFSEEWANALPPTKVEGGHVAGKMQDLQARFNLNNLVVEGKASNMDVAIFQRLLNALGLDVQLVQAVVDWLDADIEPEFPDGAEDDLYLRGSPPYRTANGLMSSPSELRLIQGFGTEVYQRLAPYVTALPERTAININTAPLPVLMSLAEGISAADAGQLLEARGAQGFPDVGQFLKHDALAGRNIKAEGLSVSSNYFMIRGTAEIGGIRVNLASILARAENGKVGVVMRSQAAY